jgi:hypothetical protein
MCHRRIRVITVYGKRWDLLGALQIASPILHDSSGITILFREVESALSFPGAILFLHARAIRIQIAARAMHHVGCDQFAQLRLLRQLSANVLIDILNDHSSGRKLR